MLSKYITQHQMNLTTTQSHIISHQENQKNNHSDNHQNDYLLIHIVSEYGNAPLRFYTQTRKGMLNTCFLHTK